MKRKLVTKNSLHGSAHVRLMSVVAMCLLASFLFGCPLPVPTPTPTDGTIPSAVGPGINLTINSVTIPADNRPVVKFIAKDDSGNIIPMRELTDCRFVLAYLETPGTGSTARFVNYTTRITDPDHVPNSGDETTQATYDPARLNGLTQAADGELTYKFATVADAKSVNRAATHQLGGQARRTCVIDGVSYPTNVVDTFRPDGGTVTQVRDIVNTETCNKCHTRLSAHGIRREIQYCILCHNGQIADPDTKNPLDFPQMIHKIHRGEGLPSVEDGEHYEIGNADFSTVAFPQDIRNCTACHTGSTQSDVYLTKPTLAGCGSCHDRTWFGNVDATPAGYANHVGGMHTDDSLCALCHTPTAPGSVPIAESHILPTESANALGLALDITAVNPITTAKATSLQIEFTAVDGSGAPITDLSVLDNVGAVVAWPAPDFQTYKSGTIQSASPNGTLVNNGGGAYTYTFPASANLPTGSTDTFAVAMSGRRAFDFRGTTTRQGTETNGYTEFTLDGSEPTARRSIVENARCDTCHQKLRMHGETRTGIEFCVMCHNPKTTDEARRPAGEMPPETVNFKQMIHKVHSGENLTRGYTVYGYGNSEHDFSEFRFPGDRKQCTICHKTGTQNLPLSEDATPTVITEGGETVSTTSPIRAACTSCHDSIAADVHALLATDGSGAESCEICHGASAEFSVAIEHAQTP